MMEGSVALYLRSGEKLGKELPDRVESQDSSKKALFETLGGQIMQEAWKHLNAGNRRYFQELSYSQINLLFNEMIIKFDKDVFVDIMNFLMQDRDIFKRYILHLKDDLIKYSLGNLFTCQTTFNELKKIVLEEFSFLREPSTSRFLRKMFGAIKDDMHILFGPEIASRAQFILNSKD